MQKNCVLAMIRHADLTKGQLWGMIKDHSVMFGGNAKLKIYGLLTCSSGKRIKKENRVFFKTENEAYSHGFRPCGHCMRAQYGCWKNK